MADIKDLHTEIDINSCWDVKTGTGNWKNYDWQQLQDFIKDMNITTYKWETGTLELYDNKQRKALTIEI